MTISLFSSIAAQIGCTDEVTECTCCGKQNLKRTVVMEMTQEWEAEGGDKYTFFGSTCAKNALSKAGKQPSNKTTSVNSKGQSQVEVEIEEERQRIIVAYGALVATKLNVTLTEGLATANRLASELDGVSVMSKKIKNAGYSYLLDHPVESP